MTGSKEPKKKSKPNDGRVEILIVQKIYFQERSEEVTFCLKRRVWRVPATGDKLFVGQIAANVEEVRHWLDDPRDRHHVVVMLKGFSQAYRDEKRFRKRCKTMKERGWQVFQGFDNATFAYEDA